MDYYTYIRERILLVWFTVDRGHLCVVGIYTLEKGKDKDADIFCKQLQKLTKSVLLKCSFITTG